VDTESGKAVVEKIITIDDAGTILNPLLAEGQRHGGIAQGIAQALLRGVVYDADGNPLTATFADYASPVGGRAAQLHAATMETPTTSTRSGPRASARPAPSAPPRPCRARSSTPCRHLGIRHIDMPATPRAGVDGDPHGARDNGQNGSNA
jgi:carbon-monoxide dehydrogenase large subunit